MECLAKPSVLVSALFIVHAASVLPSVALKLELQGPISHFPPILDCAPAPAPAARSANLSSFRSNVLALLDALPAAAAAAPTGSVAASSQSGGTVDGNDRAFCFGGRRRRHGSTVNSECLECLSAAATDVADGCHGRRRGAVWRAGCFVSYADTNASTAREDAWRGWFYDDDDDAPTIPELVVSQCLANNTAAECSRCLTESAQVVPKLRGGRQLSLVHSDVVVVVGYSCYLRVPLFPAKTRWLAYAAYAFDIIVVLLVEIGGILFCIWISRDPDA